VLGHFSKIGDQPRALAASDDGLLQFSQFDFPFHPANSSAQILYNHNLFQVFKKKRNNGSTNGLFSYTAFPGEKYKIYPIYSTPDFGKLVGKRGFWW
jgi:hypothetical protein